jgi:hypothetical protein
MSDNSTSDDLRQSSEEVLRQLREASNEMRERSERTQEMIAESIDSIERIDATLRPHLKTEDEPSPAD